MEYASIEIASTVTQTWKTQVR